MSDRYWIAGAGNWDDTAHWSTSSGGSGGAAVPTSSDDVFVDANCGFSGANQFIDANVTTNCRDFNFTFSNAAQGGGLRTFTNAGLTFNIYGSLNFADGPSAGSGLTRWFAGANVGTIAFKSTTTGKTVTLSGNLVRGNPDFNATGGGWTLQDTFTATNRTLSCTAGTLITNDKTVSASTFSLAGGTITLGATAMTLAGSSNALIVTGGTLNRGTSTITLTGNSADFKGAGSSFYDVVFNGTPTTVTGCNTYHSLTIAAGKTVNFPHTCTQTLETALVANGSLGSVITIRTTGGGGGNVATLSVPSSDVTYVDVKDNTATNPMYNPNGTDSGNNTNWFFTERPEAQAAFLINFI